MQRSQSLQINFIGIILLHFIVEINFVHTASKTYKIIKSSCSFISTSSAGVDFTYSSLSRQANRNFETFMGDYRYIIELEIATERPSSFEFLHHANRVFK